MLQDSPMTPAEEAAQIAFQEYAAAVRLEVEAEAGLIDLRRERSNSWNRFSRLYAALDEPTPPDLAPTRDQLACEGVLLVVTLAAFIGLVLPDVGTGFWPRLIAAVIAAILGGWWTIFARRLAAFWGRHA